MPPDYLPLSKTIQDDVCDPEDALFPHDEMDPVPGVIYPFLYSENIRSLDDDDCYDYPKGYDPDQKCEAPLAGGASGGNSALWETLYKVSAKVTNEGSMAGNYVAQLYIEFPSTIVASPPKVLRGFDKVFLQPNECGDVEFDVRHRDLSIWDAESQQWIIQTGTYKLYVSTLSRKVELCGEIEIGC